MITELDVVNDCLALQGESPANSLADYNPAIASIRNLLQRHSRNEQARGWWFNKEFITINQNADGFYSSPTDVLGLTDDPERGNPDWLSQRGNRLYSNADGAFYTDPDGNPVILYIVRHVTFDDLPFTAAALVRAATVAAYAANFDADQVKISMSQQAFNNARLECNAEHIRSVKANVLSSGGVGHRRHTAKYPTTRRRS